MTKIWRSSRWRFWAAGAAALLAANLGWLYYIGRFTDNFRVLSPGKAYRSAQMPEEALRKTVTAYGIKTIVNLRGFRRDRWYSKEAKVAKELGLKHVDIQMSADLLPLPDKPAALLNAFAEGPYPMLIHCWAGSDRTGLASVIYRVVVEHDPLEAALKEQLTWRYGHLPWGKAQAMDDFFDLYRETGRGKDLARWIREDYRALYASRKGKE